MSYKYTVVANTEYTYPDIWDYASASDKISLFSARGGYGSAQILLDGLDEDGKVSIMCEGFDAEIYTLYPIPVEKNVGLDNPEAARPHMPERIAPFYVYDCLADFEGRLIVTEGKGGIYISVPVPKDAKPGKISGKLCIDDTEIPFELEIMKAILPEETLQALNNMSIGSICRSHNVTRNTPEYFELEKKYLHSLRRMHSNVLYSSKPQYTKMVDEATGKVKYEFDFSELEAELQRFFDAGIIRVDGASVARRKSWSQSTLLVEGMESMSLEAYTFLSQYLPALQEMLEKHGWTDKYYIGVSDEPNEVCEAEYRALCGIVHRLAPKIKIIEATGHVRLYGAIDVAVPLSAAFEANAEAMQTFRDTGVELWFYVCCGPRGYGHINRFMDCALIASRYLHWGNYRYDLTGYLHWAANLYQPGQDPFKQSCPEHHNADGVCILPPGDTHIIYPGKNGPWISMRLENQRESAEEFEMLKFLATKDKALADEICSECFRSFTDVEYDVNKFASTRRKLIEAVGRYSD